MVALPGPGLRRRGSRLSASGPGRRLGRRVGGVDGGGDGPGGDRALRDGVPGRRPGAGGGPRAGADERARPAAPGAHRLDHGGRPAGPQSPGARADQRDRPGGAVPDGGAARGAQRASDGGRDRRPALAGGPGHPGGDPREHDAGGASGPPGAAALGGAAGRGDDADRARAARQRRHPGLVLAAADPHHRHPADGPGGRAPLHTLGRPGRRPGPARAAPPPRRASSEGAGTRDAERLLLTAVAIDGADALQDARLRMALRG